MANSEQFGDSDAGPTHYKQTQTTRPRDLFRMLELSLKALKFPSASAMSIQRRSVRHVISMVGLLKAQWMYEHHHLRCSLTFPIQNETGTQPIKRGHFRAKNRQDSGTTDARRNRIRRERSDRAVGS